MPRIQIVDSYRSGGVEYMTVEQVPGGLDGVAALMYDDDGSVYGPDGARIPLVVTRTGLGAIGTRRVREDLLAQLRENRTP
jgi:hypothetical protein